MPGCVRHILFDDDEQPLYMSDDVVALYVSWDAGSCRGHLRRAAGGFDTHAFGPWSEMPVEALGS